MTATTNTVNLDHTHSMYNAPATYAPLMVTTGGAGNPNNIDIGGGDAGDNLYDVKYGSYAASIVGSIPNT